MTVSPVAEQIVPIETSDQLTDFAKVKTKSTLKILKAFYKETKDF